jgi:hypothetical protein
MLSTLSPFLTTLLSGFRSRVVLQVEILALRHQIGVLRRSAKKRPRLTVADRVFWVWLSRVQSAQVARRRFSERPQTPLTPRKTSRIRHRQLLLTPAAIVLGPQRL